MSAQVTTPLFQVLQQVKTLKATNKIPESAVVTVEEREWFDRLGWRYWVRFEQTEPLFVSASGYLYEDELAHVVPEAVSA